MLHIKSVERVLRRPTNGILRAGMLLALALPVLAACSGGDDGPVTDGKLETDPDRPDMSIVDAEPTVPPRPATGDPDAPDPEPPIPQAPPAEDPVVTAPWEVFDSLPSDLLPSPGIYSLDGYGVVDVVRIDVRTETTPGICIQGDESGCTLADVLADTDHKDDFKVDIPVHFRADDFAEDGSMVNAELRQRGGTTRTAPQKSFRIELENKEVVWRDERKLQLNKHPFEATRTRNKLSMDLMSQIPWLSSFRTQFANLWIDDGAGPVDYGLFTHVEAAGNRWLERRGFEKADRLYKISRFGFTEQDRDALAVDDEGKPLDEARFERVLEIKSGEDHRPLLKMLRALHDPDRSFDSVLDEHFNRNNVLAWVATNVLLHQTDAVTHNLILHNPIGTERFYFVPWDYDGTFVAEQEPPPGLDARALQQRLYYGYARGIKSDFLSAYYREPGAHSRIGEAARKLRADWLDDATISARAEALSNAANLYVARSPDIDHNPTFYERSWESFAASVASNELALAERYSVPMPPTLLTPRLEGTRWQFAWTPAFEVTGLSLTYDLEIANRADFAADSILVRETGIADTPERVEAWFDASRLGSGPRFVRLIARTTTEPERFWQVASNRLGDADGTHFGVLAFEAI